MGKTFSFLTEFFRNRRMTGSMIPSSRALADELARPLRLCEEPKKVIEIGPGTGPVTKRIIPYLRPGDRFVLVEANRKFCNILEDLCATEWAEELRDVEVEIHCALLEEVETVTGFDFAVSGLPLNNFPVEVIRRILRATETLLAPTGTLSYFEYLGMRKFLGRWRMLRHRRPWPIRSSKLLDRFLARHQVEERPVLLNFPPAVVRHLRRRPAESTLY